MWNGTKLRRERLNLGVTQAALAVAAGVEQTQISQWERGTEPAWRMLMKLVEGFNAIASKAGMRGEYRADEFYGGEVMSDKEKRFMSAAIAVAESADAAADALDEFVDAGEAFAGEDLQATVKLQARYQADMLRASGVEMRGFIKKFEANP
jgi:transcriptional regulator with XRE-family HTH domain